MKKITFILMSITLMAASSVNAMQPIVSMDSAHILAAPANWTAGDNANYSLSVGTFLKGTMIMTVTKFDGTELAINQKLDLRVMKQDCNMVIDVTTGETKSLECNGQAQDTSGNNVEIIETYSEQVTVPAGTFDSTYVKARETSQNTIMEQWVNPYDVAVVGLIKMISQSQMGPVEALLTSFKKQ